MFINPNKVFNKITEKEVYEMIDIFWNIENLPTSNKGFLHIKNAKQEIQIEIEESPIFELEVLKYTPKGLANLEFEYFCNTCKHIFPLYEDRCPNCKELFSFKVEVNLVKFE